MNAQVRQDAPVYASACADYYLAGWTCVIPVPPEAKFPPPGGFTGAGGRDTTPEDIAGWAEQLPGYSIALRMPDGVIGIDVDEYAKGETVKHGAATVTGAEGEWGALPPTCSSTARGQDQPSRILFYRVPAGRYASQLGPDVEIIQRHHRYAVVAPSPHSATGTPYQWYGPDGSPLGGKVPGPGELAALPEAWIQGLAEGAAAASPMAASIGEAGQLLAWLEAETGQVCTDMAHATAAILAETTAAHPGSRHDLMTRGIYELVQLTAEGHGGYGTVIAQLRGLWGELTAGEDRDAEFGDMITTAARKAVTAHGPVPQAADPCRVFGRGLPRFAAPAPDVPPGAGLDDDELPPPEAPRFWSPWGEDGIGVLPFDPPAGLDGMLARDVLGRTWPVLRYAPDAGAWIRRGPDKWDVIKGDLSKWAVDLVSVLMPPGDPDAAQGSPERLQADRRKRFMSNSPANAIAGKMNAQVAAGQHPSAVELAALDTDREILWAGGMPFDLRNSDEAPAISRWTDPGTPHLHSAGVVPELRPVPRWDAFLAAVWPDEDVRAWALRILSISFTGYPDKALPILLGDTDRGKTSLIMLLMSVLGSYAHVADARLLAPADKSHASIVYALRGRRLSFIDEAPRTGQLATERLKQITGGADLTGNRMGENPITFPTTHTLILTANPEHEPVLTDAAIRRRVRLIPCNGDPAAVIAARAAIGAEHGAAWRAEAPGVLARMMAETARWLADPHSSGNESAPEAAALAASEIMASQDLTLQWLREECEDFERGTRSRDLYLAFTESCRRMAVNPATMPSETRWGRRLTELGYPPYKRTDANYRTLRIKPPQVFMPGPAALSGQSGGSARPHGGSEPENGGFMEGSGSGPQPSMNGNTAGQTLHETIHMEGMEGQSTYIAHTHARTRAHTQGGKDQTLHTLQPSIPPPADPPAAENPGSSPGVTSPDAARAGKPRKAARPRAVKVRPDPVLEGPVYQLPVIVARNPDGGEPLVLSCSPDDARAAAEGALAGMHVDCETSGYPPGHADFALRTVQLGDEQMAAVLDPADPEQAAAVTDLVARARVLHAHSAAADLVPLAAAGLGDAEAMWAKMTDSVLIAKLADPSLAGSDENELKKLARDLLGGYAVSPPAEKARSALFKSGGWLTDTTALTPPEKSGWGQVKSGCEVMARYAGSDVLDLAAVLRVLPEPDQAVLAREREFQRMCARVSHAGFRLDPVHIRAKIAEYTAAREAARELVAGLCPDITNPSSTKDVPAALLGMGIPLGRTKDGNPSAAKAVLEPLAADESYEHHELLRGILDYRHDVTTLGLLLEPLGRLCEHGDGRMRPVVYTINADTGRTSCVRPNGQQFSRQGGIRACVIADEGMAGVSADFSGVEIRVGAALSGDRDLLAAELSTYCLACASDPCACGQGQTGLHWMAARMAFGAGATKEDRYNSKRIIFSKMFGGGPKSGAAQVGVPVEAAYAVHSAFEQIAPAFTEWDKQMRAYAEAGNRGFRAYSGRVIWLPRGRSHAAGNYAIQGSARELLVDGCLRWHRTRWGHLPLLPIHDEILVWVPAEEALEARETLKACMAGELYGVPIEAKADEPFLAWPDSS